VGDACENEYIAKDGIVVTKRILLTQRNKI